MIGAMLPVFSLQLRFERATASDQAYIAPSGPVDYLIGGEDDLYNAQLTWDPEFISDLFEVGKPGALEASRRVGQRLRTLLPPQVRERLDGALSESMASGRQVRITLRASAAEIYALPWELLLVNLREGPADQPLGQLPGAMLRYSWPRTRTVPLRADPAATDGRPDPRLASGRVLFGWSDAGGAVPSDAHLAALRAAAQGIGAERGVVELPRLTFDMLAERLNAARSSQPISAVHLLCHGVRRGAATELILHGAGPGLSDRVDAERLRNLLSTHAETLRLVVICACHGGDAGAGGGAPLGSLAQELHKAGLAAVVASRLPLSRPGSVKVAEALWGGLLGEPCSLEEAFLRARGALSTSAESTDRATLQLYLRPEDGEDTRPIVLRPYRGLRPFSDESSRFFYGRDAERDEVLSRVEELATLDRERLLVVAGASGSGKTSLILGGVGPQLKARGWDVVVLRPVHPGGAALGLWQAIRTLRRRFEPLPRGVQESPPPSPMSAATVRAEAMDLRAANPTHKLLVVADGFEEVLTMLSTEERRAERDVFVRALWDLARQPGAGVVVALAMRLEYLARSGEIGLDEQDRRLDRYAFDPKHSVMVREMGRTALAALIEEPARRVGLELEPGLVDRILQDVGTGANVLPLLQYVLDELWHLRENGRKLSFSAYQALGGLQGALARTADELVDSLDAEAQVQARRLLVRMVWVGEDGTRARRRVNPVELRPEEAGRAAAFDRALDAFVARRLIVRGDEDPGDAAAGDWAELAHEALLRGWERLRNWLVEDEAILRQIAKVTELFDLWHERSGEPRAGDFLLRGADLGYAMKVLADYGGELAAPVVAFIEESRLAELAEQRRKRRGAFLIAAFSLVFALGMVVVAGVINSWRDEAEQARDVAETARDDAEKARDDAKRQKDRAEGSERDALEALRLAKEAREDAERQRGLAVTSAEKAKKAQRAEYQQRLRAQQAADAALAARGAEQVQRERAQDAALLSAARLVRERDPTIAAVLLGEIREPELLPGWRDEVLRTLSAPLSSRIRQVSTGSVAAAHFDSAGRALAVLDGEHAAWLVRDDRVEELQAPDLSGVLLSASRTAGGATRLLLRRSFRELDVLEFAGGRGEVVAHISASEDVTAATLRSDGAVVTGSPTGAVRVWNEGRSALLTDQPARAIASVDPIAGSLDVLVTSRDGAVRRVGLGGTTNLFVSAKQRVRAVSIDPSGGWIAVAPEDGAVEVYALGTTPTFFAQLAAQEGGTMDLAFTADGRLRTLSGDGELRDWPWPQPSEALAGRIPADEVRAGPGGIVTLKDTQVRLWQFRASGPPVDTGLRVSLATMAEVNAAGDRVVVVRDSGEVVLYDRANKVWTETKLPAPSAADPRLVGARISPDGGRVVAWGPLGTGLWLYSESVGWTSPPARLLVPEMDASRLLRDLAFDARGRRVVAAEAEGLRVWDLPERPEDGIVARFTLPEDAVRVSMDAAGERVLAVSAGGALRLWSGDSAQTLGVFGAGLRTATLLEDGRVLGGTSEGAFVWSAEETVRLPAPGGALAATVAPGGFVVVGADGAVWRWPEELSVASIRALLTLVATACIPAEEHVALTGLSGGGCP